MSFALGVIVGACVVAALVLTWFYKFAKNIWK